MDIVNVIALVTLLVVIYSAILNFDQWGSAILCKINGFKSIEGIIIFEHPLNGKEVIEFVENLIKDYNETHKEAFITTGHDKTSLIRELDSGKILTINDDLFNKDVSFKYKLLDVKRLNYLYNTRSWRYSLSDFMIRFSYDDANFEPYFNNWFDSEHLYSYVKISFIFGIADSKLFKKNYEIRTRILQELGCEVHIETTHPNKD